MIKRNSAIIILCCFILLITSCNNAADENSKAPAPANTEQALKEAIAQFPDSLTLVQNLIEFYRETGDYDSALNLTDAQIKKDSGNPFLWNMKATLHFQNDDTINAIKSLEQAIYIYPLPEYLVALGTVFAEIKNPRALIIADSLLKADRVKSGKDAMFIKGLYYSYNNDKPKAINYFDSSLSMDFTYMFAYREKAIALYDLGKYLEALSVLRKAVTLQNNFDEGYYWMGRIYEKLGKKQDAIQSFQTALLYDKNFLEARESLDSLRKK
jgi:tetratricopeptide (TPR) repeat protein